MMPLPTFVFLIVLAVLVVAAAIWLYCIRPRSSLTGPEKKAFQQYDYAHRGFYLRDQSIPENSLPAFQRAVSKGFGVELDLQLTADGHVVVFHDDTLKRMCGADVAVESLTLKELQQYSLAQSGEKIPLFSQVLKVMNGKTPMIIELKPYGNTAELCSKTCELLLGYRGLWCVESFSPTVVQWFRKNQPKVVRGQLMAKFTRKDKHFNIFTAFLARNLFVNVLGRPDFIAYDVNARRNWSLRAACRLFHAQEVCWTIRTPQQLWSIKTEGAIGIFEYFDPSQVNSIMAE